MANLSPAISLSLKPRSLEELNIEEILTELPKCSKNQRQNVDDISNRIIYIDSSGGDTSREEKLNTHNLLTEYDAKAMPDVLAAIELSLQPRFMEELNIEKKLTELPLKKERKRRLKR